MYIKTVALIGTNDACGCVLKSVYVRTFIQIVYLVAYLTQLFDKIRN